MTEQTTEITRKDLYDLVWRTPITKLAGRFGLSDVGLAKVCDRHEVPRPPRGYWAKLAHGRSVARTRLERPEDGDELVAIGEQPRRVPAPSRTPAIEVPDHLRGAHPLIKATRMALGRKPITQGVPPPPCGEVLDIAVAPDNLDRALRIMAAAVQALVAQNVEVRVVSRRWGRSETLAARGEDHVQFSMREATSRTETPKEGRGPGSLWHPRYTYAPTGRLALRIDSYVGEGARHTWRDGKKQRLETLLPHFVDGVLASLDKVGERRLAHLEREQRIREKERLAAEQAQRLEEEQAGVQQLLHESEAWHQSERLRAFVAHVERTAAPEQWGPANLDRWVAWANYQADRIDPLIEESVPGSQEEPTRLECQQRGQA